MFNRLLLIGLISSVPLGTLAGTQELQTAILQAFPNDSLVSEIDMSRRRNMANAVLAYWEEFSSRVPRLSPSETEWLLSEINQTGARVNRVLNSSEYALYRLDLHIGQCISTASKILEAQALEELRQTEMFYWVQLINCYNGDNLLLHYLQSAGLSNGRADDTFVTSLDSLIQQMIVNKAIPSAMAEAMGWNK